MFYGPEDKQTGMAAGEGVFMAMNGWLICGKVKNGVYADGKRVSVNKNTQQLRLDVTKRHADGTLL